MAKDKDDGKKLSLGDELFGTRLGELRDATGPLKGEFVPPPEVPDVDEAEGALPEQEDFWRAPVRFGTVPVEKEPLGWDRRRGFRKLYPLVMLPTQVVERVSFGHPKLEPNRLFWGDNLHVMRQLPTESIDLIYIDPPFFSGKQYNVIFGDQNELRSFSDIWEAGMPGYLVWLNARLYEMKRLLKKTGSIYVHLDWHAAHYVKEEMDKIFGVDRFLNEVIWCYRQGGRSNTQFPRKHDILLWYSKGKQWYFDADTVRVPYEGTGGYQTSGRGVTNKESGSTYLPNPLGKLVEDWWDIPALPPMSSERIGYPTQKPIELLQRIIDCSCPPDGLCADFFCGGGSFVEAASGCRVDRDKGGVARKHMYPDKARRWIACDQSRVAVAITADRVATIAEQMTLEQSTKSLVVPDFTVEHWGIYEAKRLAETPPDQFRQFVLRAYGAVPDNSEAGLHGHKGAIPIWVGESSQKSHVTAADVVNFANAVRKTVRYQQDNLRDGIMLAWAFGPDAVQAAQKLREQEATDLNFVRLDMIRIDSPQFREHVNVLSTEKADYGTFLTFVLPPRVEVGWKKLSGLTYRFDVSETVVLNAGAKIINVQWDFDYRDVFTSTQGFSFIRTAKKEPALQLDYTFQVKGRYHIACKVQDDIGGEGLWTDYIEVK
jgi:DNA modification methylase